MEEKKNQSESVSLNASHHKREPSTKNILEALKHITNLKKLAKNWK